MMHPASFDDLPYFRIAFYATRAVRLWQWPDKLRARVLVAAMTADSPKEAAFAAIDMVCSILKEGGGQYQGHEARPVNRSAAQRWEGTSLRSKAGGG